MAGRLKKLKELEKRLIRAMDEASERDMAAIARQYRETLKEIEEIEGEGPANDQIGDILGARRAAGKAGAVRKSRAGRADQ